MYFDGALQERVSERYAAGVQQVMGEAFEGLSAVERIAHDRVPDGR